jgi:hypothetical protein
VVGNSEFSNVQNVTKVVDDFKAFAPAPSFQMRISPISLGISALDMHGLSKADSAVRLRRAANTLLAIALELDGRS